jgi:hypothetical protein
MDDKEVVFGILLQACVVLVVGAPLNGTIDRALAVL